MIIIYNNNKNIYNDIKGYIVNPRDTVCKLIYASPTHLSSDSDNKLIWFFPHFVVSSCDRGNVLLFISWQSIWPKSNSLGKWKTLPEIYKKPSSVV